MTNEMPKLEKVGPYNRRVALLTYELQRMMGRRPTTDEVLDFINGTDDERIEIIRKAREDG